MTCHLPGLLLVALMFVSGGHSLKCFECDENTNNTVCNVGGPTTCPLASQDICATMLLYQASENVIIKMCTTKADCYTAKALENINFIATTTTTCCQSDGCNVNVAPRPLGAAHVTLALMGVATSVVVGRALV